MLGMGIHHADAYTHIHEASRYQQTTKKQRSEVELKLSEDQKKPHVRNSSARASGAGYGCASFVGAWHFLVLSAGNPPMSMKFTLLGALFEVSWKAGLKCQFYFYGRRDFPRRRRDPNCAR